MSTESSTPWFHPLQLARQLPALSLSLVLLLSAVFWLWQWNDEKRYETTTRWYAESGLYALEAENYLSHLAQTQQSEKAARLEAWHQQGKTLAVALEIVSDRDFAYFMNTTNNDFWGDSVYPKWRALHAELNDKTQHFSRFKWGLSGADKRPLTFFTHGFLSLNVWDWAACAFMLMALGILLEVRIGGLSILILFTSGTAITGLLGMIGHWQSATPMVGAAGGVSVLLGVYLWQRGRTRSEVSFNVRYKGTARTLVIPLFGAYWLIPWLVWAGVMYVVWSIAPTPVLTGLVLGMACGWGLQQRMQIKPAAPAPARPTDETFRIDYEKALNKLSAFDFRGAEDALAALYERYPARGDVAERLFMLRHYRPQNENHHQWAESVMDRLCQDAGNLQNVEHIMHVLNGKSGDTTLAPALLEKLLINATQAQRYEFAVVIAKAGIKQHLNSPLFIKGLRNLAQRLRNDDESVALQFEQIANDLSRSPTTVT